VHVEVCVRAVEACALEVGAGEGTEIMLVLDRAGWQTSTHLQVPEGIHPCFLPPYAPEIPPAERLWPISNEPFAHRAFPSLDAREEVQIERCRFLQDHPELVRARPWCSWWPLVVDSVYTGLI
jgi:transposase